MRDSGSGGVGSDAEATEVWFQIVMHTGNGRGRYPSTEILRSRDYVRASGTTGAAAGTGSRVVLDRLVDSTGSTKGDCVSGCPAKELNTVCFRWDGGQHGQCRQ